MMTTRGCGKKSGIEIIVPALSDPRILILGFFAIFCVYALNFPGFSRTPEQLLVSISTCLAVDFLLTYLLTGKIAAPMSGFVTSMGVFFLTDAEEPYFFALCACLAIASKHFIKVKGRHVFNPNNFGLAILLVGFSDYVASSPLRWGGSIYWAILLFSLGMAIAYRVSRASVSLGYYFGFIFFAFIRSLAVKAPLIILLAPLMGPGNQLFVFFMITDPKTSPSGLFSKIVFGALIAAVDNFFRYQEIRQAPIFALFFVLLTQALVMAFSSEKVHDDPWRVRSIRI